MNSFAGNTRHCPIMSISLMISLWYLWELKWPSIFFKRPTPYLEKHPQTWICKPCNIVLFVQMRLKRSWSNLPMVPLSQWLSVQNIHSSLKTTWYQSSVVHCFSFLAHPILFFRCLSVKKAYLQVCDCVIRTSAISCLRYILKFYTLTSYWTFLLKGYI